MALPKRRQSKTRGKKRRTHYKSGPVATTACPQCGQTKMPHRACPNCYRSTSQSSQKWSTFDLCF